MHFYCNHCQNLDDSNIHKIHHDTVYGIAISEDDELFGKLILEINQAGLSWDTILKKEGNFRAAYSDFKIHAIANYTDIDIERLLSDSGIVRNRLKVHAAIHNAQQIIAIQREFDSFFNWIKIQRADTMNDWVKIFKKQFKFVGGEICNEFLMTIARVDGAHSPECSRYDIYRAKQFVWA
jgi:DNA-3-methyladenine glycosylase I